MVFRAYLLSVFFIGVKRGFTRTLTPPLNLICCKAFIVVPVPSWYSTRTQACGLSACFLWWSDYRHLRSVLWKNYPNIRYSTFCSARHANKVLIYYKLQMIQYFVPRLALLRLVGFSYEAFQLQHMKGSLPDILNTLNLCRDANETVVKRLKPLEYTQAGWKPRQERN